MADRVSVARPVMDGRRAGMREPDEVAAMLRLQSLGWGTRRIQQYLESEMPDIRDTARLDGLRETEPVKQACRFLLDARWLFPAEDAGKRGRPRGDYTVNPMLWDTLR